MDSFSQQQQEIRERCITQVRLPPLHRTLTSLSLSSAPALLSESNRDHSDSSIIQFPSKSLSRSPRTRSLADLLDNEERAVFPPSVDPFLAHFSTPSRISRSSTYQHLITPELDSEDYSSTFHLTSDFKEKKAKKRPAIARMLPSKRGVGNIMTIVAVIAVIVFLFAGYPLTVYLTRKIHAPSSEQ
ncbi:hypothetical protein [Absidia glauca]|uniref:Uncharacterized protein n=1 Tax=Absidia glauca TaxID=4829 RepID=A0A163K8M1_ABSGL|nr:hypothetical protein [Absidia glauca]